MFGRVGRRAAAGLLRHPPLREGAPRPALLLPARRPCIATAGGLDGGTPRQRPRGSGKRQSIGAAAGKAAASVAVVTGVAYAASDDVRVEVNDVFATIGTAFEDFNDFTREFFEGIGDSLVKKKQEPWLLELAIMTYPDSVPTLVLDLDKVILHLYHDSRQGWQVIKRPFADQFFREISHYYEVVIFSDDVFPVALDIVTKWNLPVSGVLHRDFCRKKRSHYVKDLSKLGRKLDRVLMIDHDPAAFQLQPENGMLIPSFNGDTSDRELADLMEFLKAAATSNEDLREFVKKHGGGDENLGRRYLVYKQGQDEVVEQRRSMGRLFTPKTGSGFPSPPPSMGGFPR